MEAACISLIMLVLFMVFLGSEQPSDHSHTETNASTAQDSVKVSAWEVAFGLWSFGFLLDEACQFLKSGAPY